MDEPDEPALAPGVTFGAYQIVRPLGAGAFGAVYEALRLPLRKRVALKVLHAKMARNAEVIARFLREAEAAAQLAHPHIVDVFDIGAHDGTAFLAMEFLDGESLEHRLAREGALPLATLLDIMLPVLSAVAVVHEAGIVHRDLKPANLFLARSRPGVIHPKLLDFGIAKVRDAQREHALTRTSALLGTPYYMSPEQAQESRNTDARSDQFALGVILYECATGRRPFEGESLYALLHQVIRAEYAPARTLKPDLPEGFEAVLRRCLAREPAGRFASVRELGRMLLPYASSAACSTWQEDFAGAPHQGVAATLDLAGAPPSIPSGTALGGPSVPPGSGEMHSADPWAAHSADPWAAHSADPWAAHPATRRLTEPVAPDVAPSTLNAIAREVPAPVAPRRRWGLVAGAVAVVLAGVAVGAAGIASWSSDDGPEVAPTTRPTTQPPPQARPAVATYQVNVRVRPATARIEVDGVAQPPGDFRRDFPRDGQIHTLRATAAGYEPNAATFRDGPPPEDIVLAPVTPGANAGPVAMPGAGTPVVAVPPTRHHDRHRDRATDNEPGAPLPLPASAPQPVPTPPAAAPGVPIL